ncbi:MAG: DUF2914 domain-containing protein [Trichloromonas sp.]|nr:DUF2914 domain-containing protein [Trichloromonas sp.]
MKISLVLLLLLLSGSGAAGAVEIAEGVVTTQVENHRPVDRVQRWPAADGPLYCFTRIVGVEEPTPIFHVWYRGDQEMARVELRVRHSPFNTWSVKTLQAGWAGDWRVEVVDASGRVLRTVPFALF